MSGPIDAALHDAVRRVPGLGSGKIALLDSAIDHVFRSAPALIDEERLARAIERVGADGPFKEGSAGILAHAIAVAYGAETPA